MNIQYKNDWSSDNQVSLWSEKYRPKRVKDCVIPDFKKQELLHMLKSNDLPNLLLYGSSGIGKTTVARAMCEQLQCVYLFLNGSDIGLNFSEFKHTVQNYATTVSLFGGKKAIIIDEADNLASNAMKYLRGAMEEYAKNCRFIFTCNYSNQIIPAIHSRCAVYKFEIKTEEFEVMKKQFIDLACAILDKEEITYEPDVIEKFVEKYFPDFRRVLNELQKHSKFGAIDESILEETNDDSINLLFDTLKQNDFEGVRYWSKSHFRDMEPSEFYRKLYDSIDNNFEKSSRALATIKLNDYCYKSSVVQDQELNMTACLLDLMEIVNT